MTTKRREGQPARAASARRPVRTSAIALAMSGASSRSSSRCGTSARTRARTCSSDRTGFQRRVEIAALRRGKQLDADHGGGVLRHRKQPARGMRGHRHVILLIGGGRNRIHACRHGALTVLGNQCGGGDLRHHEPGIQPGLRRQECRQPRQRGVDQHGDAAFGDRADLAQREGDDVGREGNRLAMEVAARQCFGRDRCRSADCPIRRSPRSAASPRHGEECRVRRPSPGAGSAGSKGPAHGRRR